MSANRKSTVSSNDKVMHYLQNSNHYSANNSMKTLEKPSTDELFSLHRLRSCSENDSISSSSSSVNGSLTKSEFSTDSSLSDPIARSSNTSFEEELDFNIGFDQNNDDDFNEHDHQEISNKINANTVTVLDESMLDVRINEWEEFLRQSSNATLVNDDYEFNNDDTITEKPKSTAVLHDSTYTLCSEDRFSAYTEQDGEEDQQITGTGVRSNSLSILQIVDKSTFVDKVPKKIVRFADMMGLDLESIRYMTPPDQTASSFLQEYVRLQIGQLRSAKHHLNLSNIPKQSSSPSLLPSPTKQYNLVSKNFSSPTNLTPVIYDKQIMLECLYTKESTSYGTIRVHNCAFDKYVFVRLTQDEWITSHDIQAFHSMNYSHDNTDTFSFEITLPKFPNDTSGPKRILFAVCLQAMSQEFWDNNEGWNYVLDVFERR